MLKFMRIGHFCVTIGALILTGQCANAAFTFNINQSGLNVLISGSGSINTSALVLHSTGTDSPSVFPAQAFVIAGPTSSAPCGFYSGASGPARIGTGEFSYMATGTGDIVGTAGGTAIELPLGYVSGTFLSDSATIPSETLSYIGLTPGTYVDTWGSGATADSLTINVLVPEPASLAMIAVPLGVAQLRRRRGRRLS